MARLLRQGVAQAEVARRLGVLRETVSHWNETLVREGFEALRSAGRTGRKPRLDAGVRKMLAGVLVEGALAHSFPTGLWTLKRIALLIARRFWVKLSQSQICRVLALEDFSCQRPTRARLGARREGGRALEGQALTRR